mmetsp:Transcript_13794/g.16419  ORF Transcript_13794/g.16419 Transcript_13794/m.16419 type:complete len:206 (-) Transcript_13794:365-982(-)
MAPTLTETQVIDHTHSSHLCLKRKKRENTNNNGDAPSSKQMLHVDPPNSLNSGITQENCLKTESGSIKSCEACMGRHRGHTCGRGGQRGRPKGSLNRRSSSFQRDFTLSNQEKKNQSQSQSIQNLKASIPISTIAESIVSKDTMSSDNLFTPQYPEKVSLNTPCSLSQGTMKHEFLTSLMFQNFRRHPLIEEEANAAMILLAMQR